MIEEEDIPLTPVMMVLPVIPGFGCLVEEEEDISLTPVVCSASSSLSSLLALVVVVEAGTSCRSSIVAL
jgi:hypothetical protein